MPRTRKLQPAIETAEAGIKEIMATSVEKTLEEAATYVNVANFKLRDMFCDRLGNDSPTAWETIPTEYEPLLEEFKRQMEAAASVKPHELPPVEESPVLEQPPMLEEEPEAPKAKKSSRKSSALTKKKTDAIAKGRQASQQTKDGVKQTLTRIQAQAGINDAANAGTTYLQAYQATLNQVKGHGLTVLAAEMIRDLNTDSDFNPDDILADLGITVSADTQQALMEQLAPMLGKSQAATQEVLETAWGNGIDLQAELSQLDSLMSFED